MKAAAVYPFVAVLAVADALQLAVRAPVRSRAPVMHHVDGESHPGPYFWSVYHTFVSTAAAEQWWADNAEADFDEMRKMQHEAGPFCHTFLPGSVNGPILCLWETKEPMASSDFQTFIDDFTGEALVNTPAQIMPGGLTPKSAWPTMPAAATPTTGSFFWVHHTFNTGASEAFWAQMENVDMAAMDKKNKANGVANHFFLPTGPSEADPVFCVWESKEPMTVEEFQAFIDGPESPAAGTFTNVVHYAMPGAMVPSTAFGPVSWTDEMMAKIEQLLPLNVDDLVAKFKEATKSIGA